MLGFLYSVIPEEYKGKSVIKFGRTVNVRQRFEAYGELEILRVFKVQNVLSAERELHELARVYFGKAVFHKEYYSCDDKELAIQILSEITQKYNNRITSLNEKQEHRSNKASRGRRRSSGVRENNGHTGRAVQEDERLRVLSAAIPKT
jgi:hypothetical protein